MFFCCFVKILKNTKKLQKFHSLRTLPEKNITVTPKHHINVKNNIFDNFSVDGEKKNLKKLREIAFPEALKVYILNHKKCI